MNQSFGEIPINMFLNISFRPLYKRMYKGLLEWKTIDHHDTDKLVNVFEKAIWLIIVDDVRIHWAFNLDVKSQFQRNIYG